MSSFPHLDLYDYRLRVAGMYRRRDEALQRGESPATVLQAFRTERDTLFASHPQSALDVEQRASFTGLPYFPYDPAACVEAEIDTDVKSERLTVVTGEDEQMPMTRVASLRFTYRGQPASLSLFWIDVYGGGLFLPFRDATAGNETYGGGRYLVDTIKGSTTLIPSSTEGIRMVLDFNYAYNPSCAYNPRWVCPLAPRENHLSFPIRAGEKMMP
jgi:uncharacterized protein